MNFYNFGYFCGQHCWWTETNIICNDFFVFQFALRSPCPTAAPASLNMHVVSTHFAKIMICKREYDVILWRHRQRISNNNDHYTPLLNTRIWKGGIQSSSRLGHHQTSARHCRCAKTFNVYCARKLLQSIEALKFIFNYRVFSTKLCSHEMFGSREFRTSLSVAPKSMCGPLLYTTCNKLYGKMCSSKHYSLYKKQKLFCTCLACTVLKWNRCPTAYSTPAVYNWWST